LRILLASSRRWVTSLFELECRPLNRPLVDTAKIGVKRGSDCGEDVANRLLTLQKT
jgi:hypothetical protein